jgi:hypothetical protein
MGVFFVLLNIVVFLTTPAQAGQVVTDTHRQWVRKILEKVEREKSLPTVTTPNKLATSIEATEDLLYAFSIPFYC